MLRKTLGGAPWVANKGVDLSCHVSNDVLAELLAEIGGKDKVVEPLVVGGEDFLIAALPRLVALIDEEDVLANADDGVHVVGIDDGGDIVLVGDVGDELVDDERCLGIEAGVGLVAEEVARLHGDGPGYGGSLLHTAAELIGVLALGSAEVDAVEAVQGAFAPLLVALGGEHVEGEHDIVEHGHGVEEGGALEEHAYLAAQQGALALAHGGEVAPVVEDVSLRGLVEPHEAVHEHGLAGAALSDDEIGLAVMELGVDVTEDLPVVEGFI